jgi:hypothetical protein
MNTLTNVPAPTIYNVAGAFGNEHQDFNRSKYSSMFQKPIAEQSLSPKSLVPPPNLYDVILFYLFLFKFLIILID